MKFARSICAAARMRRVAVSPARRRLGRLCVALTLVAPRLANAQMRMTLDEAIARAGTQNAAVRVLAAGEREARARLDQARGGFWPAVDFTETWQRGTQPVFVFSSLLAQRRLDDPAAAMDAFGRSTALTNYRSALTVDAAIFDPGTRASVRSAKLGVEAAAVQREAAQHDVAASVVAAYGAVVNAMAIHRVVAASLASARADLTLAEQRRDQGLVTDADVLQVQLHLAAAREREIRAIADETIARARLNQIMGADLDEIVVVDDGQPEEAWIDFANAEAEAVRVRPEARLALLNESVAAAARAAARAAFLPRIGATATWEGNGERWDVRAAGWTAGLVARVNLFRGLADRARRAEAIELQGRRRVERESIDTAIKVDVRETRARLDAAKATVAVAEAAVAQAVESHRIVRDRYEGGLADITALLRAAESVETAEARRVNARVEVIVATAAWRRAVGR